MVVGDFTRIGAIRESRYVAWTRLVAGVLLVAEELTDEELDQQEDTETLEGTLEARLDDRQYTIKGRQLPTTVQNTYTGLWLLSALPLFRHDVVDGDDRNKERRREEEASAARRLAVAGLGSLWDAGLGISGGFPLQLRNCPPELSPTLLNSPLHDRRRPF